MYCNANNDIHPSIHPFVYLSIYVSILATQAPGGRAAAALKGEAGGKAALAEAGRPPSSLFTDKHMFSISNLQV